MADVTRLTNLSDNTVLAVCWQVRQNSELTYELVKR